MAMLYPIEASPLMYFSPIRHEPASSLTQHLPPHADANCLLLGCGEPRNILFTIFNDGYNGTFKRNYDFTCCDVEPAILARNIVLYSLLIDDNVSENPRNPWNLFFDLLIDAPTLQLIREQTAKLVRLSESMEEWSQSEYSDYLRIVNSETLKVLRRYWMLYSKPTEDFYASFKAGIKTACETMYDGDGTGGFCHAAGVHAMAVQLTDPDGDWALDGERYWKNGTADHSVVKKNKPPHCNPLFAYSQAGGRLFVVRKETSPLLGFHLGVAFSELQKDSVYKQDPQNPPTGPLENCIRTAKTQFQCWCDSFRLLIRLARQSEKPRLRIRFVTADAISFCIALCGLKNYELGEIANCYSGPGSGEPLTIDGHDYSPTTKDPAPLSFDVIDTTYLADYVGLLTLIPFITPLFASKLSILYTSSIIENGENEKHILESMLSTTDTSTMCTLLGVMPTVYFSGFTTRGCNQDNPSPDAPVQIPLTRIMWRLCTSMDTFITAPLPLAWIEPKPFAKFLANVFFRMMANRFTDERIPIYRAPNYTVAGFAAFLDFLKRRIEVDWEKLLNHFLDYVQCQQGFQNLYHETLAYWHLFGLRVLKLVDEKIESRANDKYYVLRNRPLPELCALVITVPRKILNRIKAKCLKHSERVYVRFWIHHTLGGNILSSSFMCVQPIFGKLNVTREMENATIETDVDGWHGSSDLHLCTYVPTYNAIVGERNKYTFSVRLAKETKTYELFRDTIGHDLEVFNVTHDSENLHLFSSLPNLKPIRPPKFGVVSYDVVDPGADFRILRPKLEIDKRSFLTRTEIKTNSPIHQALKDGAEIKMVQSSPCSITVAFSDFQLICPFAFPVAGNAASLQLARKSGWMEVQAPLLVPSKRCNYDFPFIPLLRGPDLKYSTWNLPYVNFSKLPKLLTSDTEITFVSRIHLLSSFTDREFPLRRAKTDFLTNIKESIHAFFLADEHEILRLRTSDGEVSPLLLFPGDYYLELNSHSLVREAYVVIVTKELEPSTTSLGPYVAQITLTKKELEFWKSSLPAMAEVCRDWEHKETCEYIQSLDLIAPRLCSCGIGQGIPSTVRTEFHAYATRIAISPLFGAPYLEPVRGLFKASGLKAFKNPAALAPVLDRFPNQETLQKPQDPKPEKDLGVAMGTKQPKCKVCGKESTKKCGKCRQAAYCSRECQASDWSAHKLVCEE